MQVTFKTTIIQGLTTFAAMIFWGVLLLLSLIVLEPGAFAGNPMMGWIYFALIMSFVTLFVASIVRLYSLQRTYLAKLSKK